MESTSLRTILQPTITKLTEAIDYYSEQNVRVGKGGQHYTKLVKVVEDIKLYILENERTSDEELRVSSRSNGRLHEGTYDWVEELHAEQAKQARDKLSGSNT